MRKKIIILLIATIASTSLIACGEKKTESVSEDTPVVESTPDSQTEVVDNQIEESGAPNYVEGTSEDFSLYTIDDSSVGISEYKGSAEYLIIPESLDGKTIVEVGGFADKDSLKGVILPNSIKKIVDHGFNDCSSLVSVEFGEGIEVIEDRAFINCGSLESINLPSSLVELGEAAFNVSNLQEISIPSGLTEIQDGAFANGNFEELTIPSNIKTVAKQAFAGNPNLKKVFIEDGVESIGKGVFDKCEQLTEIHIPASVTEFGNDGGKIMKNSSNVTIYAPAGSPAESYANEKGITFDAE
ncbi:leucine-rich repeat domain-containing protein [Butyrivibrio sp. JL13D10]|uniref:leucine-rich repeat domain-containing protein n=1 Tax=Butyrivibrio sp. JL13D10 TaxID=3236815 RepID=UPI0038B56EBF